jgi:hypothetical protein
VVVERDYRPAVIASVLKAARLTMFHMLGYNHIFSPAGKFLSHPLMNFYAAHRQTPRTELQEAMAVHFQPFACMISATIFKDKSVLQGTVIDNRLFACIGASQGCLRWGYLFRQQPMLFAFGCQPGMTMPLTLTWTS